MKDGRARRGGTQARPTPPGPERPQRGGAGDDVNVQTLTDAAARTVGRCDAAVISVLRDHEVSTAACTAAVASDLDRAQWEAGDGPCLDAVRHLQVFYVASIPHACSWPQFRRVAAEKRVMSSLSAPLTIRGRALGTLTLYSRHSDGFDGCEELAMRFASDAALALVQDGAGREGIM